LALAGRTLYVVALSVCVAIAAFSLDLGPLAGTSFMVMAFAMVFDANLKSVAKRYVSRGFSAKAPWSLIGRSGVSHEFSFTVASSKLQGPVVADTELSVSDVDETRILAFYVKVYDIGTQNGILLVSPRLSPRAKGLAEEYHLMVVEKEEPSMLVPLLTLAVDQILASSV